MLFIGGVGSSFGRIDNAASDNTQDIIFMVVILMCNDATVCGGIMELKNCDGLI